jgi:N-acetylmuramoyl-L-alanine amidase
VKLDRVRIYGNEYVRLRDWTHQNHFKTRSIDGGQGVEISGESWRMSVWVNSRRMDLNGVGVLLTSPVAVMSGQFYISPVDLQLAVYPVLYPPKQDEEHLIKTICLDPGHGGRDPGFLMGRTLEKKYTLLLAEEVGALLRAEKFKVIFTRSTDRTTERPNRPDFANRAAADLFVSLHFNSSESHAVKGIEVYCMTPVGENSSNARGESSDVGYFPGNRNNAKNMLLAYQVQRSLTSSLNTEDRCVRRARFEVLREIRMPGILIEGGFLSHPEEGHRIADSKYRHEMAKAIVEGILAYKKAVAG